MRCESCNVISENIKNYYFEILTNKKNFNFKIILGQQTSTESFLSTFARNLAKVLLIEVMEGKSPTSGGKTVASLQLSAYTYQIVSAGAILLIFTFNVLGVKILFRLQSVLFVALLGAVLDFGAGLFMDHEDYGKVLSF